MVEDAPRSVGLCATLGDVIAGGIRWLYGRTLDRRNADIATRNTTIEMFTAQRDRLKARLDAVAAESDVVSPSRGGPAELDFVFGDGPPFSERFPHPPGTEHWTVRVAVANTGGEHLEDCRASLARMTLGAEQGSAPFNPVMLAADGFSLRPGARRIIEIASYDARYPDGTAAPAIKLNTRGAPVDTAMPAQAMHVLRLRATAAGGVSAATTCRLFVENGRLRLLRR